MTPERLDEIEGSLKGWRHGIVPYWAEVSRELAAALREARAERDVERGRLELSEEQLEETLTYKATLKSKLNHANKCNRENAESATTFMRERDEAQAQVLAFQESMDHEFAEGEKARAEVARLREELDVHAECEVCTSFLNTIKERDDAESKVAQLEAEVIRWKRRVAALPDLMEALRDVVSDLDGEAERLREFARVGVELLGCEEEAGS